MRKYVSDFKKWMAESHDHYKMVQLWFRHNRIKRSLEFIKQYDAEKQWKELESAIRKRRRNFRITYAASAVAASLALILTYTCLIQGSPENNKECIVATPVATDFSKTGGKKATLTLHTGEQIHLTDRNEQVTIHEEEVLLLIEPDKSLVYKQNAGKEQHAPKYNTLTVPRGGEYQLILSDGTKVWLNAESSLHYPIAFSHMREVTLTGEAYFEVAPNDAPFIVRTSADHKVEVLGTKFNISAYRSDRIYTTLAEGKLNVHHAGFSVTLLPNSQAIAGKSGKIAVKAVDPKLFTSWAQGVFQFRNTELSEIAAQLSRWYDVNISFSDEKLKHKLFTGVIFRNYDLSFAVGTIERISNVKFIVENDVIYITNQKR